MSSPAKPLPAPFSLATEQPSQTTAPQMARLTTRYSSTEDRMRVAGELPGGQPVVLWMTQRLLLRLLPRMFWWLESHGTPAALRVESAAPALYADAVQGFAQQAALQELVSQSPVHTQAETPQALVESVSVGQSAAHMHFVFSNAGQSLQVGMVLDAQLLRQWLSILGRQWRDAQWPMDVWPLWLQDTAFPGGYDAQGVTH